MRKYARYKDSGISWIGEVPEHWNYYPFYALFEQKSQCGFCDEGLLSVYLDKGVIRFSDAGEKRANATSEDLSKYQLVEEGDFVLNNQQAWLHRPKKVLSAAGWALAPSAKPTSTSDNNNFFMIVRLFDC